MHKMHNSHHGSRRRQGQSDVTNRRRRQHLLPLIDLQPGQVAFQVVCHESAAGGVIGASGSIINRIRDETSCIVSFQEPKDGAEHRVIVVVGSSTPERRLVLEEGCEELVSNAQEALLRVVERMWQVYGHGRGGGRGGFCGLLASSAQIAVIVGKGGRTIVKLKKVSEAHINILPPPPCASPDEQLIQITGSVVSVKRAIILVTGYLQSFPQLNRYQMPMPVRPIERSSSSTTSHDQHLQFFPHLSSMLPSSDDTGSPLSNGSKEISKDDKQEVSFRLLVSASAAGCIIGKAGSVVKSMQNETGASILVAQSKTRSWERVVTVSAMENKESRYSPAEKAALLVFGRSIENYFEKARSSGSIVSARLLVDSSMHCLADSSGMIDAEITEGVAFNVYPLEDNYIRDVAWTKDVILEITGEYKNVTNSLTRVISKLRENVFASNMFEAATSRSFTGRVADATSPTLLQPSEDLFRAGISQPGSCKSTDEQPEGGTAAIIDSASENGMASQSQVSEIERCLRFLLPRDRLKAAEAKVPEGGETKETKLPLLRNGFGKSAAAVGPKTKRQLGLSDLKSASLPRLQTVRGISESEKHSTTLKPGAEHDERKKPASVKNETIEVTISAEAISAVYGKDGSNLDQIRKISGAKVAVVDEPDGKWEEVKIVISGTADEAKVAQSLLQASILRGGH